MKIPTQKLIEILITACLSAGIAFLQSLLTQHTGNPQAVLSVTQAGLIGGLISTARNIV